MANKMINRDRTKTDQISYVVGNYNLTKDTGDNNLDGDIRKFSPPLCPQIETTCRKRKVSKSKYSIKWIILQYIGAWNRYSFVILDLKLKMGQPDSGEFAGVLQYTALDQTTLNVRDENCNHS